MNALAPVGGADLQALTRELNLLDRTRDDHVYQLGLKLIPIRQILQQMNGVHGARGADGLSPRGWGAWCESARINLATAAEAVARAVNPEGHRQKRRDRNQDQRRRPTAAILLLKRAWPNWTEAEQQSVIDTVVELARGA